MITLEKTAIYGLPISPNHLLPQLAGASFCVSYATRQRLGAQLDQAIELVGADGILLIDNGAFSMHRQGISSRDESYLDAFEAWALPILDRCPQAVVVVPDVIGGSEKENRELLNITMLPHERCMPIWHMHESIEYFLHLCEGYEYVGIGSSGAFWKVGTPEWHARLQEAFDALEAWEATSNGAYIRPRIHLMRAQSQAHLYPVDSSDSCNVVVNSHRYRHEGGDFVARFAARAAAKIEATSGAEAEHQIKRPLQGHLEAAAFQQEMQAMIAETKAELAAAQAAAEALQAAAEALQAAAEPVVVPAAANDQVPAEIAALVARKALFVANHSGGKDSQAMLIKLREMVPADQLLVVHASLGEMEWEGALELARDQAAAAAGLPFIVAKAINLAGEEFDLLDKVEATFQRRPGAPSWPSAQQRYCTSDLKRGPIAREIRRYMKAKGLSLVVNCIGIRAQESDERAKAQVLKLNVRETNAKREWYEWHPILGLTIDEVWATIREAGQEPHPAYAAGNERLSCVFCIMGSDNDIAHGARVRPELFARYVAMEERTGYTMHQSRRSLREIVAEAEADSLALAA